MTRGGVVVLSKTPISYIATWRLSIRAEPTMIDFRRINDTSTSCPLAMRAFDFDAPAPVGTSTPARRASSGVTTVILAPVSSRNVARCVPFSTTGTRNRFLMV